MNGRREGFHVHMLITLKERDKPRTVADVDRLVRAEIPDPVRETRLYEIVAKLPLQMYLA